MDQPLEGSSNVDQLSNLLGYKECQASTNLYMPQVRDEDKPKIGQEFGTIDDVLLFYNNYAKLGGFSVRLNSSRRSKHKDRENELLMKEYVCYKEGKRQLGKNSDTNQGGGDKRRCRGITREGCKARLRVTKSKLGNHYIVSIFEEEHNHPLATPGKVGFLRSHRQVSEVKKCLMQQFSLANISTNQQMSVLELQAGGLGSIGCTERDIHNEQSRVCKMLDGHDAKLLYEHFLAEQESNSSFAYVFEADSDGKLKHVFWADASMRMAYYYYGDVIVFDTAYNTNRYGMVFAPILGVNNHGKTVTFSCAFLSDETTDSFEWLFSHFLRLMPGPPPNMIITDQNLAIEKAVATKLESTYHSFCIWHILNKFSDKLGPSIYDAYYNSFKICIWDTETKEEFDEKWKKLLEISNLQEHKWLDSLFVVRGKWVPAYVRHIFSAGTCSSQRAESHHSFFKRYCDRRNSLADFIQRFNRGLARQRHEELNDEHVNINERPCLKTPLPIEKQMADSYTKYIFHKFQEELWQSMLYRVILIKDDENTTVYKVVKGDISSIWERERELVEPKNSELIACSCQKFDSEGIPCRHILALLKKKDIDRLPMKYILRRWTKEAKKQVVVDGFGVVVTDACDKSLFSQRTMLSQLANSIVDDVLRNEDDVRNFQELLLQFRSNLKQRNSSSGVGDSIIENRPHQFSFKEPSQVSFKRSGMRLKRAKEMPKPKGRRCNYCGGIGVTHDKRNCPKKKNIISQGECSPSEDDQSYEGSAS